MSNIAVRTTGLGKRYRVGEYISRYRSLRDALGQAAIAPLKRARSGFRATPRETIWALRGVDLEVHTGEAVGLIGRNGAGKTTLLKILSRITEPTEGFAEISGRVGSLLEVGSGFHPELTGRENVFLNGAILGMGRAEIAHKFDDIIDFADIARFIDTPVKRYSTGMRMRLAFSVAAHLEPEILLVDEVLAVGDAEFQRKCLTKMNEVSREGRTVLFVSHNLAAVSALCSRAVLIEKGEVALDGSVEAAISHYLRSTETSSGNLSSVDRREGIGPLRFDLIRLTDGDGREGEAFPSGGPLRINLSYTSNDRGTRALIFQVFVHSLTGERVLGCSNRWAASHGRNKPGNVSCFIPRLPLVPGEYVVDIVCKRDREILDHIWSATRLTVVEGDFYGTGKLPPPSAGRVMVDH
ncbi:MAG: ABC transporter ATP-binding protein, partial [Actinobacteria bacterium]|nr:ABC transporter ATP-binding protein [Actinomycetota bacterium]